MNRPFWTSRPQQAALLGSLYTAQGLPFGFFTLALPVLLREAGWSLTWISLLQALALPWALKFLWAPWLDRHGDRRTALLLLQGAACALALLLAALDLRAQSAWLLAAVLLFNLIAASQDVITDGLAVRWLNAADRGLANALQVGAYRFGMILGGGLLLWLHAQVGATPMFLTMAVLLALCSLPVVTLRGADAAPPAQPPAPHARMLLWLWWWRLHSPAVRAMAGVIICYRFGDQMVSSLITPLLVDQGLDRATIALMKGAVGSATSLLGALLGGALVLAAGRRRALLGAGLGQAACFALYLVVAAGWGGSGPAPLLWTATVLEGVVGTMATVALFTLMMDAADPLHAGTDYSVLASVVVLVGSLAGLAAGLLGDALGIAPTLALGTALASAGTWASVTWLDRRPPHARVAAAWPA